ncbi:hypothetical protein OEZ86_005308 [Tetradesmus obliquus]|nr:hypothetical protein OEZ86_005308 [Tetradesmus obliquus]
MRRLVQLIGGEEPSEAGLQFILGLSIACGLKKQQPGSSGALDSAVGHLFRAAAGLTGAEAAPLRLVLQLLRQRQGSSGALAGGGSAAAGAADDMEMELMDTVEAAEDTAGELGARKVRQEAQLRLQFCQAVVLLFEREGVTQGALAFARAALGAADAAYGPEQQQEKVQNQAALWASVFNFASELDLIHDAYTAALSNPLPERAAESVIRLAQSLVDRGQLQQLLSLPWAGVLLLSRNGLKEPVPVVELVIDKLTRRALHSELSVTPCPHQGLFDFLTAWGNYKAAAAAMLSHARRLRAAGAAGGKQRRGAALQETVEEVMAAYAASTAMLQLLDSSDAWLDPDQPLLAPFPAPPPRISSSTSSSSTGLGSLAGMAQQLPVITLQDLQREAALFGASALLLQQLPGLEVMQYGLSGDYVLEQLLGAQQFAAAVQLVHTLYGGPELAGTLAGKLEAVAFALAGACVKLQQRQLAGSDGYGLQEDEEGFAAATAGVLAQGIMSYTGPGHLGTGIAGGMAGAAADPAALMRVFIKHGRLLDAAQLAKDHLEAWQRQGALLRAQPGAVWLPLQGLELLHASLVAGAARAGAAKQQHEAEVLGTWSEVLEMGIAEHVALVGSDTGKLGAAVPAGGGGGRGGGGGGGYGGGAMGMVF